MKFEQTIDLPGASAAEAPESLQAEWLPGLSNVSQRRGKAFAGLVSQGRWLPSG